MLNDLISIIKFDLVGNDERGITSAFTLPRAQSEFMFLTRKAGSLSGNTYHRGTCAGTNPKTFILVFGVIKISYRKVGNKEVFVNVADEPSTILVSPEVVHKIEVIEDAIFMECNSVADLQFDRVKELV